MTKKQNTFSKPLYKPDKDNRYAIARNQPDLLQCRLVVHKHGPVTEATVYQYNEEPPNPQLHRLDLEMLGKTITASSRGPNNPHIPRISHNFPPKKEKKLTPENLKTAGSGEYTDQAGSETKDLKEKGDIITIKGLAYETDVIYQGDDKEGENPFEFQYAAGRKFWDTNLLKFFAWNTQSKGTDKSWQDDGSYCKKNTKSGNDYVYECYFPCSG
ncbi:MAG: hypothetical protein Q9224_000917 [Gallowayella concinna]